MIRVLIAAPTPALRAGLRALVATTELQIAGAVATLRGHAVLQVGPALLEVVVRVGHRFLR